MAVEAWLSVYVVGGQGVRLFVVHSGHHPALRCWQHLVGVSEDAVCRLCVEEIESGDHIWLRCQALLVMTS